jgi:hypothetical protein
MLDNPYRLTPEGFLVDVFVHDEMIPRPLTNWVARIVGDVLLDDGSEQRRQFEIEASVNGQIKRFRLPPSEFEEMNWPLKKLGPTAIIVSGL